MILSRCPRFSDCTFVTLMVHFVFVFPYSSPVYRLTSSCCEWQKDSAHQVVDFYDFFGLGLPVRTTINMSNSVHVCELSSNEEVLYRP